MLKCFFFICHWLFWKWVLMEHNIHIKCTDWIHWVLINVYNSINHHHNHDMKHFFHRQKLFHILSPLDPSNCFVFFLAFCHYRLVLPLLTMTELYSTYSFVSGFFYTTQCFRDLSMLSCVACSLLLLIRMLFYEWYHLCLSIHLLMDIGLFLVWGNYE